MQEEEEEQELENPLLETKDTHLPNLLTQVVDISIDVIVNVIVIVRNLLLP